MSGKKTREARLRSQLAAWLALLGASALLMAGCVQSRVALDPSAPLVYPITSTVAQVDELHGVKIADPYRWLEDDQSPRTREWVVEQNRVTFDHLGSIPQREAIQRRLRELWNYERYGVPFQRSGRYFFTKNDGLQNQGVLYVADSLEAKPRVLLDSNRLSSDGTVALANYSVSEDGNLLAYGVSIAGSDWQEWRVRDVRTGSDLADRLRWVKFSGASWTKDGKGFFYSRYDEPKAGERLKGQNFFHKLYFHRIGTSQSADELVYHRPDQKQWGFGGEVTEDGRYLIITVSQGTDRRNRVFYRDLATVGAPVVELLNGFDASYDFLGNEGATFWFRTDLNAPRGRVIAVNLAKPSQAEWKELVPQSTETLRQISVVNDQFIGLYLRHARSEVRVFGLDGKPVRAVALPGIGTVSGFGGRRSDRETFFSFTSFTVPGAIYRHDLRTGASRVFRQPKLPFNSDAFVVRQILYTSRDGQQVPMFIAHKKGLVLDGRNPTYLYGYGGFNISLTPTFSVANLVWMEMGGVFAMPNLRGGGEYGEEWHKAGMKAKKQTVFNDFIAAAEWLQANLYTRPEKLALGGGSNGGLLVGACLTQRPELFGAALPAVGVMDMLRFHKFTIGWAWQSEYGSPDNAEDFRVLRAYSPLHNLRPGTRYPATLITTGDHDDRVVPAHSFKFAAALQAAQTGEAPALIRIETNAGHGAGKPTEKLIAEAADKWAFLVRALEMLPTLPTEK